jgi:uncharacterized protein (UPF0335 family)
MKYPRIEVTPEAFDALQIEAVIRHKKLRDLATQAILEFVSDRSKQFVSESHEIQKPKSPEVKKAERKHKSLVNDAEAQKVIQRMKEEGATISSISKTTGYAPSTIRSFVERMERIEPEDMPQHLPE